MKNITSFKIKITRPIIFFMAIFVMNVAIYSFGYRLTADDISYHHIAISKDIYNILKYSSQVSFEIGRIGHHFVTPLSVFGSYITEYLGGRIIASSIHFLSYIYFSYYISLLTRRKIFIPLSISYFALSPLLYSHTPPTSYPLLLSIPFILILFSRIISINGKNKIISSILLILLTLTSEYSFLIGATLLIIENLINIERRLNSGLQIFSKKLFIDFSAITLSLIFYISFRIYNPSSYVGVTFSNDAKFSESIYIGLNLIWNGTVFPYLNSVEFSIIGGILAFLFAFFIYFSFSTANKTHWQKKDFFIICALVLCCIVTVVPFAFQSRMYEWCIIAGDCTYVISRLSYFYLVPIIVFPILITNAKFLKLLLIIISIPATLSNVNMAKSMHDYTQPFRNIAEKACENENFYPGSVSMHPHFDEEAYWIDYRAYLREKLGCRSVGSLDTWKPIDALRPGMILKGSMMKHLLIEGWGDVEVWGGAWSTNKKATINLPAEPEVKSVALRLRTIGNQVKPPIDQELAVTCSNERPARFEAPDGYVCSLTKGESSKIIVAVSELLSPSSLGINGDTRLLGVALHEVEFRGK